MNYHPHRMMTLKHLDILSVNHYNVNKQCTVSVIRRNARLRDTASNASCLQLGLPTLLFYKRLIMRNWTRQSLINLIDNYIDWWLKKNGYR